MLFARVLSFAFLLSTPAAAPNAPKAAPGCASSTLAAKESAALAARRELEGKAGVQLGLTVKKEQAVFGEWYSQVGRRGYRPQFDLSVQV